MSVSEGPNTEYRIVVRFGDELLQAGFTAVPNLVLRHYVALGITPTEMMFIIHIWQYWWNEKDPYPSLRTISDRMGISWRNAQRYVASLKQKAVLVVTPRFAAGLGQMTNEYDFSPLTHQVLAQEGLVAKTAMTDMAGGPTTNPSWGGMTNPSWAPTTQMSSEEYESETYPDKADEFHSNKRNSNLFPSNRRAGQRHVDNPGAGHAAVAGPNGTALHRGSAHTADVRKDPHSRPSSPTGQSYSPGRGRPPKAPDQLAAALEEASQKLNDEQPRSSLTRVTKLWKASGLPVDKFCQRVYQAMAETRQAQAKKPSAYGQGVLNRMPLFFAELERTLGFRDDLDWSVRYVPPGL